MRPSAILPIGILGGAFTSSSTKKCGASLESRSLIPRCNQREKSNAFINKEKGERNVFANEEAFCNPSFNIHDVFYVPKGFKTLSIDSFVIARKEVSEDLVYKLMKTMFEHIDEFRKIIKAASDTTLEGIEYINVPLHPGALKCYKEKGIAIPPSLMPHE